MRALSQVTLARHVACPGLRGAKRLHAMRGHDRDGGECVDVLQQTTRKSTLKAIGVWSRPTNRQRGGKRENCAWFGRVAHWAETELVVSRRAATPPGGEEANEWNPVLCPTARVGVSVCLSDTGPAVSQDTTSKRRIAIFFSAGVRFLLGAQRFAPSAILS